MAAHHDKFQGEGGRIDLAEGFENLFPMSPFIQSIKDDDKRTGVSQGSYGLDQEEGEVLMEALMCPRAFDNSACYCGSTTRMQTGKFSGHHSDELLWVNIVTDGKIGECAEDPFSLDKVQEMTDQC